MITKRTNRLAWVLAKFLNASEEKQQQNKPGAHFEPPRRYRFPAMGEPKRLTFNKLPARRWFEYHCWENEESCDADLWHHTHQMCTVIRRLPPDESDYEMYEVKFDDGKIFQVMWDELLRSRKDFERPDYVPRKSL